MAVAAVPRAVRRAGDLDDPVVAEPSTVTRFFSVRVFESYATSAAPVKALAQTVSCFSSTTMSRTRGTYGATIN